MKTLTKRPPAPLPAVQLEALQAARARGLTADRAMVSRTAFEDALEGRPVSSANALDLRWAVDRFDGVMGGDGDLPARPDQARALAAAVVTQAVEDLRSPEPGVQEEAREFLIDGLWAPDVPWAQLLGLRGRRGEFLRRCFEQRDDVASYLAEQWREFTETHNAIADSAGGAA